MIMCCEVSLGDSTASVENTENVDVVDELEVFMSELSGRFHN